MKRLWPKNKILQYVLGFGLGAASMGNGGIPPHLRIQGRSLSAHHSSNHRPLDQSITIADKEDCNAKTKGAAALELSEQCSFLTGLYRYIYLPEGSRIKHQILMGFSVSKTSPLGYTLLTEVPIEISEDEFTPVNSSR